MLQHSFRKPSLRNCRESECTIWHIRDRLSSLLSRKPASWKFLNNEGFSMHTTMLKYNTTMHKILQDCKKHLVTIITTNPYGQIQWSHRPNPCFFQGLEKTWKIKRKECVNPSIPHHLTVPTLCHLAIKDCQHLKNIHDAFLTAST